MNQEDVFFEIQKKLIRTKERFPLKSEMRKGKNVVTEAVYVTNVAAFIRHLRENYIIQRKAPVRLP